MDPTAGKGAASGRTLGHYRLIERIGAGGVGEVWRAQDERLERDVALKVLLPGTLANEAARRHFRKEALVQAKHRLAGRGPLRAERRSEEADHEESGPGPEDAEHDVEQP